VCCNLVLQAKKATVSALPDLLAAVSPHVLAALLLVARTVSQSLDLEAPSAAAILKATGVGRSRAYELSHELLVLLPGLERPVGRPASPPPEQPSSDTEALTNEVLAFVLEHPGCVHGGPGHHGYSDGFRGFVLDLQRQYGDLDLTVFAEAVHVPLPTLKDWLRSGTDPQESDGEPPLTEAPDENRVTGPRIESILHAWKRWDGDFRGFCNHVQHEQHIPYGRTMISGILEAYGARIPRRRAGRSPDEIALKGQLERFFPGAQWTGDGSPITVWVDGEPFSFNLELLVDTCSAAATGASFCDEEDSAALIQAFADGVDTTGSSPLALLVDNRFSNHTHEVEVALGNTLKIRATLGRPQTKGHVEGSFGLFAQTAPHLSVVTADPREIARQVLALVVMTWARTLNHKPRPNRQGRSRVQQYLDGKPTPEQVEQARQALQERCRQQEKAYRTRQARLDPLVRSILDDTFDRLGLDDPDGHIRDAIARYPIDAVLAGIAVFEGKRAAGTLPPDVGGRYLLGIVRNVTQEDEGYEIAEALWRARQDARDRALKLLDDVLDGERKEAADPLSLIQRIADRAIGSARTVDHDFWLRALADAIEAERPEQHQPLFRVAARRIHATHAVPHQQRLAAVRRLAAMVQPVA
jgi:hypothetical protein